MILEYFLLGSFLPEVFTAGGPELVVVPDVMVDAGLGQHGVVLDL